MMSSLLALLGNTLDSFDLAIAHALGTLLPNTDTDLAFWYVVPLTLVTVSLILGEVLHDRRMAAQSRSAWAKPTTLAENRQPSNGQWDSSLTRYSSRAELIEAKAQARHAELVARADLIGANGKRISDIEIERDIAAHQLRYVFGATARDLAVPEASAWYIKDFGYCPA